jgi:hypothetical protein
MRNMAANVISQNLGFMEQPSAQIGYPSKSQKTDEFSTLYVSKKGSGLLKNTNLRRPLALRDPGKTPIIDLQIGLFQQARVVYWYVSHQCQTDDLLTLRTGN